MKIIKLMLVLGCVVWNTTAHANVIESEDQVKQLIRAAQYGSGEAMVMVAVAHANGEGVEANEGMAMRWIREAIRFRNPQAYLVKSQWLRNGNMLEQDIERADYWLERAVKANYVPAIYEMAARMLRDDINNEAAVDLLSEAADEGHLASMYLLARLYESGMVNSTPQYEQAVELYSYLAIRNFRDSREKLYAYERFFTEQQDTSSQKLVSHIQDSLAMEVITVRPTSEFDNTIARISATYRRPTVGSRIRRGMECERNVACTVVFDRNGVDVPASTVADLIY